MHEKREVQKLLTETALLREEMQEFLALLREAEDLLKSAHATLKKAFVEHG
jgi:hypothetical protein